MTSKSSRVALCSTVGQMEHRRATVVVPVAALPVDAAIAAYLIPLQMHLRLLLVDSHQPPATDSRPMASGPSDCKVSRKKKRETA